MPLLRIRDAWLPGRDVSFPIIGKDSLRHSLIQVQQLSGKEGYGIKGKWAMKMAGATAFAGLLDSAWNGEFVRVRSGHFLVQSPVMAVSFLGKEAGGSVLLVPVYVPPQVDSCLGFPSRVQGAKSEVVLSGLGRCFANSEICSDAVRTSIGQASGKDKQGATAP